MAALLTNPHYDDIYARNGLPEKDFIFIKNNNLTKLFAALPPSGSFTVGELGFGLGLAFLATAAAWRQHAPPGTHLTFISFEKHVLPVTTIRQAHQDTSLVTDAHTTERSNEFLHTWPSLHACGWHGITFPHRQIALHLYLGDAADGLANLQQKAPLPQVNAWFLDGHDPRKNPALWAPSLFSQLAALSIPGATTAATYSCAATVRNALHQAGFLSRKQPGPPPKRKILTALYQGQPGPSLTT